MTILNCGTLIRLHRCVNFGQMSIFVLFKFYLLSKYLSLSRILIYISTVQVGDDQFQKQKTGIGAASDCK